MRHLGSMLRYVIRAKYRPVWLSLSFYLRELNLLRVRNKAIFARATALSALGVHLITPSHRTGTA